MLTVEAAMGPAREYVDKQIEVMRKYGSLKKLTPEDYEALVVKIAKITVRARGGKVSRC